MSPKYQGGRPGSGGGGVLDECPNCAPDCSFENPCDDCCWQPDGSEGICGPGCNTD